MNARAEFSEMLSLQITNRIGFNQTMVKKKADRNTASFVWFRSWIQSFNSFVCYEKVLLLDLVSQMGYANHSNPHRLAVIGSFFVPNANKDLEKNIQIPNSFPKVKSNKKKKKKPNFFGSFNNQWKKKYEWLHICIWPCMGAERWMKIMKKIFENGSYLSLLWAIALSVICMFSHCHLNGTYEYWICFTRYWQSEFSTPHELILGF